MTKSPRLAIVSHTLPPESNGQAIMLQRILAGLDPTDYFFISARTLPPSAGRSPVKYVQIPERPRRLIPYRFGLRPLVEPVNFRLCAAHRAKEIARVAVEEHADIIVGCTGDLFDLPAAYLAARSLKLPLFVYLFDWYAHQFDAALVDDPSGERIVGYARQMEPLILGYADRVIAPNEYLRTELRKRYGLQAAIVRNPTEFTPPEGSAARAWPGATDPVRIVYTGCIYEAHFDAFHNLLAALKILGPNWRLTVYTSQPHEYLRTHGINGPVDLFPAVGSNEVQSIQQAADLLFLPLAFQSPYPEIVRTSAPGKIGDYLASGSPIVVHAPEDSFLAWYFKRHECGVVVDRLDAIALADGLRDIAANAGLRERCRTNAIERLHADFSVSQSRRAFAGCIVREAAAHGTSQPARDMPLVSVIIPTFNRSHLLCDAIDSVLAQDYPHIELIVVDDGSTDDTAATVARYGDRIRYVVQSNAGPAVARNHGIRLATGDYVAFLDSDDVFLPGKIRKQVELLQQNPRVVLAYCHYRILTGVRTLYSDATVAYEGDAYHRLLKASSSGTVATPSVMVRREILLECGGFDESMALAEDTDLWCRIARRGWFGLVPEYLVEVRVIERGISATPPTQAVMVVWQKMLDKAAMADPTLGTLFLRQARARLLFNAWKLSRTDAAGRQWGLLARALVQWPLVWMGAGLGEYLVSLPRIAILGVIKRLVPARTYIRSRNWWRKQKRNGIGFARHALSWISGNAERQL